MHIIPTFIAHTLPAKLVQPGERALDYPARQAKVAAMLGLALADLRPKATLSQDLPIGFTVVATVGLHALRFAQRWSSPASNRWQAIEQGHELDRIMTIRSRENHIQRRAGGIDEEAVLAACLAPVSRGGAGFSSWTARTDELSAITREKSIRSALRSFASKTRCN